MTFSFVGLRRTWFAISGITIVGSIIALLALGLNYSIDFTGGSLMELHFATQTPSTQDVAKTLTEAEYKGVTVQTAGSANTMNIRTASLTDEEHVKAKELLKTKFGDLSEERYNAIGPVVGGELRTNAVMGVLLTLLLIGGYIAFAFRGVSEPVQSWKYGLLTVFCAFHDVIIPLGVFAILGHFFHWEVGTAFVAAILTILGYSISDTVVVFDRTRENLAHERYPTFEETVEKSIQQTYVRSINTSVTTLLALLAIVVFGGETTRPFAVALMIGIGVGTYSSIFIASPALVAWQEWSEKRAK